MATHVAYKTEYDVKANVPQAKVVPKSIEILEHAVRQPTILN